MDLAEERISDLRNKLEDITQNATTKDKVIKKKSKRNKKIKTEGLIYI
jgi:hypothetical protein